MTYCERRHVDPAATTVPQPEGSYMISVDVLTGDMTTRAATPEDMRHCASCTCPPEELSTDES